jgi:hypothetical protein
MRQELIACQPNPDLVVRLDREPGEDADVDGEPESADGAIVSLYTEIHAKLAEAGLDADGLMRMIDIGPVDDAIEVRGEVPSQEVRELIEEVLASSALAAFSTLVIRTKAPAMGAPHEEALLAMTND